MQIPALSRQVTLKIYFRGERDRIEPRKVSWRNSTAKGLSYIGKAICTPSVLADAKLSRNQHMTFVWRKSFAASAKKMGSARSPL
jgi:hypothetical protein